MYNVSIQKLLIPCGYIQEAIWDRDVVDVVLQNYLKQCHGNEKSYAYFMLHYAYKKYLNQTTIKKKVQGHNH